MSLSCSGRLWHVRSFLLLLGVRLKSFFFCLFGTVAFVVIFSVVVIDSYC